MKSPESVQFNSNTGQYILTSNLPDLQSEIGSDNCKFYITLEKPFTNYKVNERICGKLELFIAEGHSFAASSITLSLKGLYRALFIPQLVATQKDPQKTMMNRVNPFLNIKYTIKEFDDSEKNVSGYIVIPFEFLVPNGLPSSLMIADNSTSNFSVTYFITAQLDPDNATNPNGYADPKRGISKVRCEKHIFIFN